MAIYFISDWHFSHKNVIEYENRPFKNVEEMDSELIRRHNERVKPTDTVYFLGDITFNKQTGRECVRKLNGNIIFVEGNHDRPSNGFKIHTNEIILRIGGMKIQLIHNPEYAKVDYPLILSGHHHGQYLTKELKYLGKTSLIINMSVENWNYAPATWHEIEGVYYNWKKEFDLRRIRKK